MTRISDMGDAEGLRKRVRTEAVISMTPDVEAGPRLDHRVVGQDMDGVEVDPAALRQADADLERLQKQLFEQLREAADLAEPLRDGTGPVATDMRRAFRERADDESGVHAALEDYIEELTEVRTSIREVLAAYEQVDQQSADALRRAGEMA